MIENKTVTVEAEFVIGGNTLSTINQWTFEDRSPTEAKDYVISSCVPLDAELYRVGLWHGTSEDRPEGGHESGILENHNHDQPNRNRSLFEFEE